MVRIFLISLQIITPKIAQEVINGKLQFLIIADFI